MKPMRRWTKVLIAVQLSIAIISAVIGSWWTSIFGVLLAALFWTGDVIARRAYLVGWTQGRVEFMTSMQEAMRRGMSVQQWAQAELERTLAALDSM